MKRFLPVAVVILGGLFVVAATAGVAVGKNDHHRRHAQPVIFDNDADFDDTVALAALAEQHIKGHIDLRAVTITNNGAGLPGKGYQHVRCLLDSLGLAHIPVADATYDLPHALPDLLCFTVDTILDASIPDCAAGHIASQQSASELLAEEVAKANGRLTLIATGPLTNVALAMDILDHQYPQLETASRVLAEHIPYAQLVIVKDAGHFPHMEKPEIVNEAIWQWLEEKIRTS